MKELMIVDGYNIIFAWDTLKKLADQSLEHARVMVKPKDTNLFWFLMPCIQKKTKKACVLAETVK